MRQRKPSEGKPEFESARPIPLLDRSLPIKTGFISAGAADLSSILYPNHHTMLYASGGSAILELTDREIRANDGEFLLIGSQHHSRIRGCCVQSARLIVLAFCRDVIMNATALAEGMEYLRSFESRSDQTPRLVAAPKEVADEIVDLIQRIQKESELNCPQASLTLKTYLKMILVLLRQQCVEQAQPQTIHPRNFARLQPLLDRFTENHMDAIPVERAAQLLNMSKSHFMRYFRRTTGISFVPYLNRLRISKAQELMRQQEISISEVGEAVGLYDQSYFSKVFRQVCGVGPREYRDQHRKVAL